MLWVTYFMGLVIYYVLLSWMPILMQGLGYQLEQSAMLTSLFTFGGTLGILVAGWLMDRWNAHKVVSSGFVVTALLIVAMATEDKQIVLLGAFIFLMGVTMNGAQSGLQTLAATFYPTHSRATGIAWMGHRPLRRRRRHHDGRPTAGDAMGSAEHPDVPVRTGADRRHRHGMQDEPQADAATGRLSLASPPTAGFLPAVIGLVYPPSPTVISL